MDIAQQLSEKYPGLFEPLIDAYRNSKAVGKVELRHHKMIEDLLSGEADVITMSLASDSIETVAKHFGFSIEDVQKILAKYNKIKKIKDIIINKSNSSINELKIQQLEEMYGYIFQPLIDIYLKLQSLDPKKQKEITKLIDILLDKTSNNGHIIKLYNEGFTLQEIGDQYSVSRERIRQIIRKYDGYHILVGSKEWCLKELDILIKSLGDHKHLPSNKELNRYNPKLIKSLRENFLDQLPTLDKNEQSETLSIEERQEISKKCGFDDFVGTKAWCLQELEKIVNSQGKPKILPSNQILDAHYSDLTLALRENFTQSKAIGSLNELERIEIVKALEYDINEEIKNHKKRWSLERLIYELHECAKLLDRPDLMPIQKELSELGRQDLTSVIQRFGGQSKVAKLAGLTYQGQTVGEDGRTYWTEERIRAFLYDVAEKEGHPGCMPTQAECAKYHPKGNVVIAIFTNAGNPRKTTITWPELAEKYGLKYDLNFQRVTIAYIKSFVKSIGHSLYNLTPSEIYVLFEQQRINKAGINTFRERTFDTLVEAIQSGNLPREEIDKWANDHSSEIVDALLDPENKTVEEAFRKVKKPLNKTDHKSKTDNHSDENYQEEIDQNLPAPNAGDTLQSLSVTTNILVNGSSDQEAINFLIAKAKTKLWKRCFEDEKMAIIEAQEHKGNIYSETVRDAFIEEYTRCKQLPIPQGYSFKDDSDLSTGQKA